MAANSKKERRGMWIAAVPMFLLALSCLYPIYFAINNALKDNRGYILDRFGMVTDPSFENFVTAWSRVRFSEYFMNSVITTVGAVFTLLLVPLYQTIIATDLLNTRTGLIISYTAFFLPFSIYLMTAFYAGIPRDLTEAARIDGARFVQVWWYVMLPMGKPALLTLAILNTLYCWNDVLISLLVLQNERTLMVGITALRGEYTTNVPLLAAAIVLAAAPIIAIYLLFQRHIVAGIAAGAVKG